ncbi:MAG: sialate O-acetylesterase [bacterium]
MMNRLIITAAVLLTLLASAYAADPVVKAATKLKLPAIFSDHMVLQREIAVPVWGWAVADEEVTVAIVDQTITTKTGADGKWKLTLKPLTAADSIEMVVKGKEQTITIKDVAVGEVWVASGQSNMCIPINRNADDLQKIMPYADDPGLRMCPVAGVASYVLRDDVTASWIPSSSKPKIINTYGFSAIGYAFAQELRRTLKVPVGIFVAAVGGVPGTPYISPEGMEASNDAGLKNCAERYRKDSATVAKWKAEVEPDAMVKYLADKELAKKNNTAMPIYPKPPVVGFGSSSNPSMLYNGQLGPLQPYAIRGALWYQGESGGGPNDYRALLDALVADWRKGWNNPEMALLVVQITAQSPEFREKQLKFWQATPNTGLAVINDTCDAKEWVHVKYKTVAAHRLSLIARAVTYGEKIEYSGPVYDSVKFDGPKAVLSFTHVGAGLAAKVPVDPTALVLTAADMGGDLTAKGGVLKGFTIAGADNKFVPAIAEIVGDTVVVSSDKVTQPTSVRYLWSRWPELWTDTTLYNLDGLPAPPFRTDKLSR